MRRRQQRAGVLVGLAALMSALAACGPTGADVPVVNLYGGASAPGFEQIIADCNTQAGDRYRIVGNLLPSDADSQRDQLVRRLVAKDDGLDLLGMDVTWTAEFAEAGWIRRLTPEQRAVATRDTLASTVTTALWKRQLYAIPKHTNVQLLWYRKSLVPRVPETWDGVLAESARLKLQGDPFAIALTGAQYEGVVVAFNTILSSLGGRLIDESGTSPTVDDTTVRALAILKQLASQGYSSGALASSQEPEVFRQLESGRAAFAMTWPYVLSAMRTAAPEVADDLGYARLPAFEQGRLSRVTLGGMNYAVSSFSRHPEETFEAALCLRSPEHQSAAALAGGDPPVARSLYEDPEFQQGYPTYDVLLDSLATAVPRPVTPLYQNLSSVVASAISPPASIRPEQTAAELAEAIQRVMDGRGILP